MFIGRKGSTVTQWYVGLAVFIGEKGSAVTQWYVHLIGLAAVKVESKENVSVLKQIHAQHFVCYICNSTLVMTWSIRYRLPFL